MQSAVGLLHDHSLRLADASISMLLSPSSVPCISSMSLRACRCVSAVRVCLRTDENGTGRENGTHMHAQQQQEQKATTFEDSLRGV
jgi:hypothetical protein